MAGLVLLTWLVRNDAALRFLLQDPIYIIIFTLSAFFLLYRSRGLERWLYTFTATAFLLSIINDILDFSKIEAEKLEVDQVPFDLVDVVEKTFTSLALRAHTKKLELLCEMDTDLPPVILGDPNRLKQVLLNLLGNAIKFTDRGEILLSLFKGDGGGTLSFSVRDTGIGISKQQQELLFQSFSQIDSDSNRKFSGTGLGLAISKKLVELMVRKAAGFQGKIMLMLLATDLHQNAEQCREFGVDGYSVKPVTSAYLFKKITELFSGDDQEPLPQTTHPAAEPRGIINQTLQILLVEDKPMNRKLTTLLLEKKGWNVTPANNGRYALELLAFHFFDLIFMDIQMPEMDGLETTQHIRAAEKKKGGHVPVIAITAYAMQGDREQFLAVGMDGYVAKPINARDLYQAVEEVFKPVSGDSGSHADAAAEITSPLPGAKGEAGVHGEVAAMLRTLGGDKELMAEMVALLLENHIRTVCHRLPVA